jgi:hypothetical protein
LVLSRAPFTPVASCDGDIPCSPVLLPLLLDVPVAEESGFAAGPFLLPGSPLTPGPELCGEGGMLPGVVSAAIAGTAAKSAANAVAAISFFMGFHP